MTLSRKPIVGIIMGSDSDLPTMQLAADVCSDFAIPYEMKVVSAHRTPDDMTRYGKSAHRRGIRVIIAGAGGAAHLPGMIASHTPLPVIGVPIESKTLKGIDSLLSIAQMPAGVPVATVAIGNGKNAGLLAASILGTSDLRIRNRISKFKTKMARDSRRKNQNLTRF
jgi:5-(carboxyamino)imidazole ribonucleotide mutase